jgi:hypothetical protein
LTQIRVNKDWSNSTIDAFAQDWADLPAGDVLVSKNSTEMGQLTNAIYKQLLEEQTLSGLIDDDSSVNKQKEQVQFALDLGIEDSRIALTEELEVPEILEETTQGFIEENKL